jgi:hypothetical protein
MEQLANFLAETTLNMPGDLSDSDTTITVVNTVGFPTEYPFRIRINDELLKVTASPGTNQYTVVRGDGGTTAAIQPNAADVSVVLTKEALDAIVSIQNNGTEISNRRVINIINADSVVDNSVSNRVDITIPTPFEASYTLTNAADWTILGSATLAAQGKGALYLTATNSGSSGEQLRIAYRSVPATPWVATFRGQLLTFNTNSIAGFCFLESSDSKVSTLATTSNQFSTFQGYKYNNTTSYSGSSYFGINCASSYQGWYRLADNGTNRTISYSIDGFNWHVIHTIGRTDFLIADKVGFFVNPYSPGAACGVLVSSFSF